MTLDAKRIRSALGCAALFILFGLLALSIGHGTELAGRPMSGGGIRTGPMTPLQAYIAAGLCFALAAYAIILGFWTRRDR